ncbi:MAG: hypothetical protein K2O91_10305 [Lachnospiraceae bacterium]|nr:hypothetical protein [Lachnospiraceae bacterium]
MSRPWLDAETASDEHRESLMAEAEAGDTLYKGRLILEKLSINRIERIDHEGISYVKIR